MEAAAAALLVRVNRGLWHAGRWLGPHSWGCPGSRVSLGAPPVLQPRAVHGHQGPGLCQVLALWLRLATELIIFLPGG